jgi:phytanoyl-CoA hydroxylase
MLIDSGAVERYRRDGYIVVEGLYSGEEVARMRQVLAQLIEGARGLETHDSVYDLEPSHRPDAPRVRRIKLPFKVDPVYRAMAEHPRIIEVLKQLIGPDIRIQGGKINLKSAEYGSPVEWHQDWAFYPHTNDDLLAIGVMLDDMTMENGPLMVVPGSHLGPTYDHHIDGRFAGAIDPANCPVDFSKAVPLLGRAGSCSFHHVRLIHGSAQNLSGRDRTLLLYQMAAADAWDLRGLGKGGFEEFEALMIAGKSTLHPRIVPTPVRMPYPGAVSEGSIYENQTASKNRYFAFDRMLETTPAE